MTTGGIKRFRIESLLQHLPPVDHAFAYGSGVFKHFNSRGAGTQHAASVVDYIISVRDPATWHRANLDVNPGHYGALCRACGSGFIAAAADSVGTGVHFNPYVSIRSRLCKYGVISTRRLVDDLTSWRDLYVAGRLHKPVRTLVHHPGVDAALRVNARAAVCAAMLLLPERFSTHELYRRICGLSYHGDVRMAFAEDKRKLDNIVEGSMGELDALYMKELLGASGTKAGLVQEDGGWIQSKASPASRAELMMSLPRDLLSTLFQRAHVPLKSPHGESYWSSAMALASTPDHASRLERLLAGTVRRASMRQAFYGFFTTDLSKSSHYFLQKLRKGAR